MLAVTLLGLALLALRPGHAEDELELDLVGDDDPVLAGDSSYEDALGNPTEQPAANFLWVGITVGCARRDRGACGWRRGGKEMATGSGGARSWFGTTRS
jgi:hypothetical protein